MKKLRKISLIVLICIFSSILFIACASSNSNKAKNLNGSKGNEIQNDKKRLLAYGAVLSSRNNMSFDGLKTTQLGLKDLLKESWDITDRKTALESLDWLVNEGHRTEADEVYEVIKAGEGAKYPKLKDTVKLCDKATSTMKTQLGFKDETFNNVKTVTAWDTDRLVNVSRWCYTAGYISEDEAWSYINKAVSMAQTSFNSWEEYYISCAYGRAIAYDGDIDELIGAGKTLFKDKNSVWKKYNFK